MQRNLNARVNVYWEWEIQILANDDRSFRNQIHTKKRFSGFIIIFKFDGDLS